MPPGCLRLLLLASRPGRHFRTIEYIFPRQSQSQCSTAPFGSYNHQPWATPFDQHRICSPEAFMYPISLHGFDFEVFTLSYRSIDARFGFAINVSDVVEFLERVKAAAIIFMWHDFPTDFLFGGHLPTCFETVCKKARRRLSSPSIYLNQPLHGGLIGDIARLAASP